MTLEQRVVHCARGWIGTRFCHQGRVKKTDSHGGGVDCLGLLVGVAEELSLCCKKGRKLSSYDELNYPHYPDTKRLAIMMASILEKIPSGGIEPADIVLLNVDGLPQHMGIVAQIDSKLSLIHAYAPARAVVEHHIDAWWQERIISAYRISQ